MTCAAWCKAVQRFPPGVSGVQFTKSGCSWSICITLWKSNSLAFVRMHGASSMQSTPQEEVHEHPVTRTEHTPKDTRGGRCEAPAI